MEAVAATQVGFLVMRCRFCNTPATSQRGACRVCGARFLPATPNSPVPTVRPKLQPLAPVPLRIGTERSPELLAHIAREMNAPPIVASSFLHDASGAASPVLALENGELQIWNIERGLCPVRAPRRFARRTANFSPVTCAAFSLSGAVVATGGEAGQVQLHQLESFAPDKMPGVETSSFAAHRGRVLSLAFAGTRLWSAGADGVVLSLALSQSGATSGRQQVVMDGLAWLRCLAVSPDGALLALGGESGQVQVWHSSDGTPKTRAWALGRGAAPLQSLAFSRSGQMLLGTDAAGTARLWAGQTGHELQQFAPQTTGATALAPVLAPDNRLLAAPGCTGKIRLLDAWTGKELTTIALPFSLVQSLAFSDLNEDGRRHARLLIAGAGEMVLWEIRLLVRME